MQLANTLHLVLYLDLQMKILPGSETAPGCVMSLWILSVTSAQLNRDQDNCASASLMSCWGEGL